VNKTNLHPISNRFRVIATAVASTRLRARVKAERGHFEHRRMTSLAYVSAWLNRMLTLYVPAFMLIFIATVIRFSTVLKGPLILPINLGLQLLSVGGGCDTVEFV